jgi:inosine/xanthosine triphosphatase
MMRVVVASHNPVKLAAVSFAFAKIFQQSVDIIPVSVASGVSDQPLSDAETLLGAQNRVAAARAAVPDADYWAGIEGGIEFRGEIPEAFGWAVIASPRTTGRARSATFVLPPEAARRLRAGEELGPINDQLFDLRNSKQQGGAVGALTRGAVVREELYRQAILLALIPFLHKELYL